jgi:hypothetical protein
VGHRKIPWKLKPKPKKSRREPWPVCPLCTKGISPDSKRRTIIFNGEKVLVHEEC